MHKIHLWKLFILYAEPLYAELERLDYNSLQLFEHLDLWLRFITKIILK